jgi:hypothetical protein
MPFDAALANPPSLSEALARRGLIPVGWEFLAEHKQDQVRRHGPEFLYRHQALMPIALMLTVAGMAATGPLLQETARQHEFLPWCISLGWMGLFAGLVCMGLRRVRAGAHWEERWIHVNWLQRLDVPEPIAALARDLSREVPGSTLTLGELVQEEVVLDPYLIIECGAERVCLGIWEDGRIVACAEMPPGLSDLAA